MTVVILPQFYKERRILLDPIPGFEWTPEEASTITQPESDVFEYRSTDALAVGLRPAASG